MSGVRLVPAWGCLGYAEQAVLTGRQQKEESLAHTGLARSSLGPLSPLLCSSHSPQVISFSLLAATTIYSPVTPGLTFAGLVPSWGPTCSILVGALDQLNQEREQLNSPLPSIPILCLLLCSKNHNPSVPKTGHQGVILRPSLLYASGPTDSITSHHLYPRPLPMQGLLMEGSYLLRVTLAVTGAFLGCCYYFGVSRGE